MTRHLIILPDGTEIFSGSDGNAIVSVSLTEQVNSNKELTLGSCCSSILEVKLFTPKGNLNIAPGSEILLYRVDGNTITPDGIFILEQPTRPSANTMKLTGYDRITKLDKDLTEWLSSLDGWPYDLLSFADMVCEACGLSLVTESIPNGTYPVHKFTQNQVTGRQLMKWCGELACRFVRATPTGGVEFAWYTETGAGLTADGDSYYFAKSLKYEDYATAPIDAVQMQMADGSSGVLLPAVEEGANSYAITKNPLLSGSFAEDIQPVLDVIQEQLQGVTYTPMKVSCPTSRGIRAGDIITVTDRNGVKMTTYVMSMTRKGTKTTLGCTGSQRRDSAGAQTENPTTEAVNKALDNQTQEQIFNKLTNGGQAQGIYIQNGQLFINASYLKSGVIKGIKIIGEEGSIGGFDLSSHSLSTTFRKEYGPFTEADLTTITELFLSGNATAEQVEFYDVTENGKIDAGDAMVINQMIKGNYPSYSEVRVVIDATNPVAYITCEVTGGFRAGFKTTMGCFGMKASDFHADKFHCSDSFVCNGENGYTGEVTVGNVVLTINGGIITGVS